MVTIVLAYALERFGSVSSFVVLWVRFF